MSIDEVLRRLRKRRCTIQSHEVVDLYRDYMAGHPALLVGHPRRALRQLPHYLAQCKARMTDLEKSLQMALMFPEEPRFVVIAATKPILEALAKHRGRRWTCLGYAGGSLCVDGVSVPSIIGCYAGLAVVRRKNLIALLRRGDAVGMQFQLDHWFGWVSNDLVLAAPNGARQYQYNTDCVEAR